MGEFASAEGLPVTDKWIIYSQIRAGTTFVGQDEEPFLKEEQVLWTGSKLVGKHSWPFSFQLPKEVSVKDGDKPGTFRLPPNYTERASPAYIDYRLVVTVKRGFLKVNQTCVEFIRRATGTGD